MFNCSTKVIISRKYTKNKIKFYKGTIIRFKELISKWKAFDQLDP
jgi:hypothetical protein